MRYLLAGLFGLPVALVLGANASLLLGGEEPSTPIFVIAALGSWLGLAFYAWRAGSPRRMCGRTAAVYAAGAFALPVSVFVSIFVAGSGVPAAPEAGLARTAALGVLAIAIAFGLITGGIAAALACRLLRSVQHQPR